MLLREGSMLTWWISLGKETYGNHFGEICLLIISSGYLFSGQGFGLFVLLSCKVLLGYMLPKKIIESRHSKVKLLHILIWLRVWGIPSVSLQSYLNRKKVKLKNVNAHLILACDRLTVSALTQYLNPALPGAGILEQCLQAQLLCLSPAPTPFLHDCPWSAFPALFSWSLEEANLILIVLQLIPLFVVVGAGCVGAAGYVMRLALKNPDCTWVSETAALLCFKYSLAGISVVKWGSSENKTIHTPRHSPTFKGVVLVVS